MLWQVIIPGENSEKLSKTITVEAENWFSALRDGLEKHGVDGKLISNLSCNINADQSVTVTDAVTRRVYTLRPIDGQDTTDSAPTGAPASPPAKTSSGEGAEGLPSHTIFFTRDEAPKDGSGIFYRERLLAVEPGFPTEEASFLVHHYFKVLKKLGSPAGTKLFITVHIFDHKFEKRSQRPAVAALTWKEWNPKKPKVLFPLSGEEGITFSKIPSPVQTSADQTGQESKKITAKKKKTRPKAKAEKAPVRERRARISEPPLPAKGRRRRDSGVEEKMVQAFERMQEIYRVRDHDGAASFVLSLSRDLIKCDAGSCMLISPGKFELYVAASEGPVAEAIKGKKLSIDSGIVGFAARSSVVVVVADPANDPRFHEDFDTESGYLTKNVLCSPIQHEGQTLGAIELINSPNKGGFTRGEANLLSYISTALAEYINTSLPSREADFSDRDFLDPSGGERTAPRKPAAKKKKTKAAALSKSTQKKKISSKAGSTSKGKTQSKSKASTKAETTSSESQRTQGSSTAKTKKKKKRKR